MEFTKTEVDLIEEILDRESESTRVELNELALAVAGGGTGTLIFA